MIMNSQKYWWMSECPDPHPSGHCPLCLTFHVEVDGERWTLSDNNHHITFDGAKEIVNRLRPHS